MTEAASSLYFGRVMHHRLRPFRHRFTYRVFSIWLDIDRIAETASRLRLFSHNRFNLFGFHDKDHGCRDGAALRPWVEELLARDGIDLEGGRISILCYPRILGYVFNPLSVFFCHDAADRLRAIIYEVKNTFGEQHCYVLPLSVGANEARVRQGCDKHFYVSPFIGMQADYRFMIRPPAEDLSIVIRQSVPRGPQLIASMTGRRADLRDATLLKAFCQYPLMTLKIISAIHWEALWIWLKGATYHGRPPAPDREASYGPRGERPAASRDARLAGAAE